LEEAEEHNDQITIGNSSVSKINNDLNNLKGLDWDTYKVLKTKGPEIEYGIVKFFAPYIDKDLKEFRDYHFIFEPQFPDGKIKIWD